MTTGRINQVTVLRARNPRLGASARGYGYRGSSPFPGQSKSPTDQSRPPVAEPAGRTTRMGSRFSRSTNRVPSPPISHASGSLPRSTGPESNPSVKTTCERPHLRRGLPERGGSPIDWLRSDLAQRLTDPHPSPQLAEASKALCRSYLSRLQTGIIHCPPLEPGHGPFPSGHILQGRRINRSDPGRPAVPKRCRTGAASAIGRSRRQASRPSGPSTRSSFNRHSPSGRPPSRPTSLQGPQQPALANS